MAKKTKSVVSKSKPKASVKSKPKASVVLKSKTVPPKVSEPPVFTGGSNNDNGDFYPETTTTTHFPNLSTKKTSPKPSLIKRLVDFRKQGRSNWQPGDAIGSRAVTGDELDDSLGKVIRRRADFHAAKGGDLETQQKIRSHLNRNVNPEQVSSGTNLGGLKDKLKSLGRSTKGKVRVDKDTGNYHFTDETGEVHIIESAVVKQMLMQEQEQYIANFVRDLQEELPDELPPQSEKDREAARAKFVAHPGYRPPNRVGLPQTEEERLESRKKLIADLQARNPKK